MLGTLHDSGVWMLRSHADPDAPILHFAHATGMCASLYTPLLDLVAPGFAVIASDARGHGRTALPADPATLTSWGRYRDDLAALVSTLPAERRLVLAGHSMGATVSMELAARIPDRVAAVVMIEPAFVPFARCADYATARAGGTTSPNPMAEQAERRRDRWPSRDAVRAAYRGRGVFATWSDAALDAYLDGGLRDLDDGTVGLACAPAWEAATFRAVSTTLEAAVCGWRGGLTLLYGTERSTVADSDAAAIEAAVPGATRRRFYGADHFLPLHAPEAMAAAILAFA